MWAQGLHPNGHPTGCRWADLCKPDSWTACTDQEALMQGTGFAPEWAPDGTPSGQPPQARLYPQEFTSHVDGTLLTHSWLSRRHYLPTKSGKLPQRAPKLPRRQRGRNSMPVLVNITGLMPVMITHHHLTPSHPPKNVRDTSKFKRSAMINLSPTLKLLMKNRCICFNL